MHFTNRAINGQLQSHCTTLWNPTKAQISMKFSKHAWHVDPLDSFNHVWPSNRKGNWAAKEMLPNREVVVESNEFRNNFHRIFRLFFALSNQSNRKFSNRTNFERIPI